MFYVNVPVVVVGPVAVVEAETRLIPNSIYYFKSKTVFDPFSTKVHDRQIRTFWHRVI